MKHSGSFAKLLLVTLCTFLRVPIAAQVAGGGITVGGYPVSQTEAFNVLQTNFPGETSTTKQSELRRASM